MKWISVKDRLPEPEIPVLVTYIGFVDGVAESDGIATINYGEWCWYEDKNSDNDEAVKVTITHWMPLPEPPKESPIDF